MLKFVECGCKQQLKAPSSYWKLTSTLELNPYSKLAHSSCIICCSKTILGTKGDAVKALMHDEGRMNGKVF